MYSVYAYHLVLMFVTLCMGRSKVYTYLIFSCLCSVHYLYNALWLGTKCVLQKIIV